MVGSVNTAIDFGLYIGLTRVFLLHYFGVNVISFFGANIFSFFANKHFTFRNRSSRYMNQYTKFLSVSLVYLVIVQSILYFGVEVLDLYDIWAKVMANGIGMIWNFFAHKHWSFGGSTRLSENE